MGGERAMGKSGVLEIRNSLVTQRHVTHERLEVVWEGWDIGDVGAGGDLAPSTSPGPLRAKQMFIQLCSLSV